MSSEQIAITALQKILAEWGKDPVSGYIDWQRCVDRIHKHASEALETIRNTRQLDFDPNIIVAVATNGRQETIDVVSIFGIGDGLTNEDYLLEALRIMGRNPGYLWEHEPQPVTVHLFGPVGLGAPLITKIIVPDGDEGQ